MSAVVQRFGMNASRASAERHRAERDEHERPPAPERRVERVAPRADHERQREGEGALGREHEADEGLGVRVAPEERRQVRRGRRQRPGEAERARAEDERLPASRGEVRWRRSRETAADDVEDRPLGTCDLLVAVGKPAHHPAREDLLETAVDDPAREPRVELATEDTLRLALLDHALDHANASADVVDLAREVGAPRDLAHHDGDEVGIVPPRAEEDLDDPPKLLVGTLVGRRDASKRRISSPQFSRKSVWSTSSFEAK